jgi:hypothetical protein
MQRGLLITPCFTLLAALLAVAPEAGAQAQRIDRYEIREGTRLYVSISGEDRLISTRAIKAWPGWTPQTLLYAERDPQNAAQQRLRWYDSFTRNSTTITVEDLNITDVITARLSSGDYAILVSLRQQGTNLPSVVLATPSGVFQREPYATFGTAANDRVELLRWEPAELAKTGGKTDGLKPIVSMVPLRSAPASAAGMYEVTLPVADASSRTITLNLRRDGSATLISVFGGKRQPIARRGKWVQTGADVRVDFEHAGPSDAMVWTLGANGLTPKAWNRNEWGVIGLPLRRIQGTAQ